MWKRTKWRGFVLRVQRSAFISIGMRRSMLNSIGADIHPTACVNHSCWLGSADLVMGAKSYLNSFAYYDGEARLTIEAGVRVAVHSIFITASHKVSTDPKRRSSESDPVVGPIMIGEGTWVGSRTTVLPGRTLGTGSVYGAGSIVTHDGAPDGIYLNSLSPSGVIYAQRQSDLRTYHERAEAIALAETDLGTRTV